MIVSPSAKNNLNPMDLNLDNIPKILYKYRSFDPGGYSLKLALNGEVYFSSAEYFNDPFDNYFIPWSESDNLEGEELRFYLHGKALQHHPEADEQTINEYVEKGLEYHYLRKIGDPQALKLVRKTQIENWGIASLTANPKSLPMWGYYGDCHKGLCIGLRTLKVALHQRKLCQQNKLLLLHKVKYSEIIPEVCIDISPKGISKSERDEIEATLYIKSYQWKHEDEYRLIFSQYVAKNYIFGKDSVAEVIIGAKASKDNRDSLS